MLLAALAVRYSVYGPSTHISDFTWGSILTLSWIVVHVILWNNTIYIHIWNYVQQSQVSYLVETRPPSLK